MKLHFLSSLSGTKDLGGAQLRNKAIKRIYQMLGFEISETFTGTITTHHTPVTLYTAWINCWQARNLFKRGRLHTTFTDIYHYDTLKHFHWDIRPKSPIIYNAHNLEFENYVSKNLTPRALRLLSHEMDCMELSLQTLVCSQREKDILVGHRPLLENKITVLPNLVDASNYISSTEKKYVAFIGSLAHTPNIQAVDFLIKNIQKLKDPTKKLDLLVAGRGASKELREKINLAGIKFMPDLSESEMLDVFSKTAVLMVPLLIGGGTRLKIVEALMSGARVVTTPLGGEGLPPHLLIQAELSEFANAVQRQIAVVNSGEVLEQLLPMDDLDTLSWFEKHGAELGRRLGCRPLVKN